MTRTSPTDNTNCDWYAPSPEHYDETWSQDGVRKPHWDRFIQSMQTLGCGELDRLRDRAGQFLRENGVTYNVYGDPDGLNRPWELDPIPLLIEEREWTGIEAGLMQRARLLDLILKDLYGARDLIKRGLIPLELIFRHRGFLRPCDQVQLRGEHQLIIQGAEMARGPDHGMWILGDRTQAPSGAGYALENRMAMTHILPTQFHATGVRRHAAFFLALRNALAALAPRNKDDPNVVILTPGPRNETYFEHAYLAAYLGYTLVQGNDLTVREGHVWLKALDGLKPVDVILRRVDDDYCDPLELRDSSQLGVPGLLEAARRGNAAIANPLGSGVLENPGLLAFLPALCRHLLGEDLLLPSVASWWCGQKKEREYVLANLNKLVIKPIYRHRAAKPVFGALLSRKGLESLRVRILAQPHLYVGQESVSFSTMPALVEGQIEARHAVMRSFMVAQGDGYAVMPGGLTRSALAKNDLNVSNQAGGISKDTWVLSETPEPAVSLWQQVGRGGVTARRGIVPSRTADNLFWVGRYFERAELFARALRVVMQQCREAREFQDEQDLASLPHLLRALTHITISYPGFVGDASGPLFDDPRPELRALLFDGERSGSLSATLRAFVQAAYAARDLWSGDTWRLVDDIDSCWQDNGTTESLDMARVEEHLDDLITRLMAFSGLLAESMLREAGWQFLDMGRCIERGMLIGNLLRATLTPRHPPDVEHKVLEAVLLINESLTSYRRRYRTFLQLRGTLELLMFEPANPRSLLYQLNRLQKHIVQLPGKSQQPQLDNEDKLVLEAITQLRLTDPQQLTAAGEQDGWHPSLDNHLAQTAHLLSRLSETLSENYFSHTLTAQQLAPLQPEFEA